MTFATSASLARLAPRLRNGVLIFFALVVAHDAIFVAQFGFGSALAAAMSERGHDQYWIPFSVLITLAASAVFLGTLAVLGRLQARASMAAVGVGPSYAGELVRTWLRLFPTVALLFTLQENLERFSTDGHFMGLNPLGGAGYELALPVLAIVTFLLACVGAVARWRIAILRARATATKPRRPRPASARLAREWVVAIVPYRWTLGRPDAGRAPPTSLRSVHPAAV